MLMKIFVALMIIVAIGVGLGTQLPRDMLIKVIIFRDFFDAALPVLAFGALIKYLCTCCHAKCCCGSKKCGKRCGKCGTSGKSEIESEEKKAV